MRDTDYKKEEMPEYDYVILYSNAFSSQQFFLEFYLKSYVKMELLINLNKH